MLLTNLLNRPWPFTRPHRSDFLVSLFIGGLVYFIIAVLKPFGIENATASYLEFKLLGYWAISSFWVFLFQRVFPKYLAIFLNAEGWTVGKTIFSATLTLLLIGISVGFYTQFMFPDEPVAPDFWESIVYVYYIGVIPAAFIAGWNYIQHLQKYTPLEILDGDFLKSKEKRIRLIGNQNAEDIEVDPLEIILISALGNYINVFYDSDGELKRCVIRQTLKGISSELPTGNFFRCHRSHIVNIHKIKSLIGGAKNCRIMLDLIPDEVQVSRKYVKHVKTKYEEFKPILKLTQSQSSQSSKL